jgi:hypothetical protein
VRADRGKGVRVGKNKIRTKGQRTAIRFDTRNAGQFGVPCDVYMLEQLCLKCRAGLMRPTGRVIEIQPNRPGMVHECTNRFCDETHTFTQPFPRPEFAPRFDPQPHAAEIGRTAVSIAKDGASGNGAGDDSQE